MNVVSLSQYPHKRDEFIKLVEKSFGYEKPFQFSIDFYPLVCKKNSHNCSMFLDSQQQVIATCAAKKRWIYKDHHMPIYFLGAISVSENFRHKGLGKDIVSQTLKKLDEVAWYGLWSEKKGFFNALGFDDYGEQFFLPEGYLTSHHSEITLHQSSLDKISQEQKLLWKEYYLELEKKFITLLRSDEDWREIYQISSAHFIEIFKGNSSIGYAVAHKGMDLQNVVHEFYVQPKFELSAMEELNQKFSLWLPIFNYDWDKKFLGKNLLLRPAVS